MNNLGNSFKVDRYTEVEKEMFRLLERIECDWRTDRGGADVDPLVRRDVETVIRKYREREGANAKKMEEYHKFFHNDGSD